jgi:hypothetical protein
MMFFAGQRVPDCGRVTAYSELLFLEIGQCQCRRLANTLHRLDLP